MNFLKNISLLSFSVIVSGVFLFILRVILVRWLGPDQYGVFSFIFSLTYFFYIPMLIGFNIAATRYIAKEGNKNIVSTAFISVTIFITLTLIISLIGQNYFSRIFSIDPHIFRMSALLTAILSILLILKALFQGLQKFKIYALVEMGNALTTLISIILFIVVGGYSYQNALYGYMASFLLWIIILIFLLRPYFGAFSFSAFRKLFSYSIYSVVSSCSLFLLITTESILLFNNFGAKTIGLQAAYLTAANGLLTNKVLFVLTTVLFPLLSHNAEKGNHLLLQINKMWVKVLTILIVGNIGAIYIIMLFFGKEYPFRLSLAFLFSFSAGCNFITQLYVSYISSRGVRGIARYTYTIFIISCVGFILNILFIPTYGIYAAIIIVCIINGASLILIKHQSQKLSLIQNE